MKLPFTLFAASAIIFLIVDMIWLTVVARGVYQAEIGVLLKKEVSLAAAVAFYAIYIAGLTYFVLLPTFDSGSLWRVFLSGAAFGLVAYATYDLTNLATINGFTLRIALIDMAWGSFLTGLASSGAVWTARQLA